MLLPLSIVVIACSIVFLALVFRQVACGKMLLRYSFLWITLALVVMLAALFPEPIYMLSSFIGFENPSNFIFFAALFFLLALCLSLSIIISKQAIKMKNIIQEAALTSNRVEDLEKRLADSSNHLY